MTTPAKLRVGLIGARGYVGSELIALIAGHPRLDLAFASSRALAGQRVGDALPADPAARAARDRDLGAAGDVVFAALGPAQVAERPAEVYILALPNGLAGDYVAAIDAADRRDAVIIDVSADHRFAERWVYGQPERFRSQLAGARRIANPGCYATAAQLAIWPIVDHLAGPPHIFGVSGYSGAGTRPSPKNDPAVLRDNLLPYALTGHVHQREVARHLDHPVYFTPHVAPFFRGITVTVSMVLREPATRADLAELYGQRYRDEPLIRFLGEDIPQVRDIAQHHHVEVGGLSVDATDPRRVVVVATIDNLLKGAATQAVQNINLALDLGELSGIMDDAESARER
ncbi:MAG: N-acetyl-gamma-glutamyl-phosphate reductase [Myxococcota bacterium]